MDSPSRAQGSPKGSITANPFQWKNLYQHRFGTCTYAPPIPRNPSTTLPEYPNIDAFHNMTSKESTQRKSLFSGALDAFTSRRGSSANANRDEHRDSLAQSSNTFESSEDATDVGGSKMQFLARTSYLVQRKTQQLVKKRRDVEEIRKQNPHNLDLGVLRIQQRAWLLMLDDHAIRASGAEARAYCSAAMDIRNRLMTQLRTGGGGSDLNPFSDGTGVAERYIDRCLPTGHNHPVHSSISNEESMDIALMEFLPFFTVIAPPQTVTQMHTQFSTHHGKFAVATEGGAGDTVGIPMFSQYGTWQEAFEGRSRWSCTSFHYFLTRDLSYNYTNVSAILVMLETLWKHTHKHNGAPMKAQVTDRSSSKPSASPSPPPLGIAPSAGLRSNVSGWTGRTKFGNGKCNPNNVPNSCPLLALETTSEDVIIVFEHAGSRNALHMATSVIRFFLDKALRPAMSKQLFGKEQLLDIVESSSSSDSDDEPEARPSPRNPMTARSTERSQSQQQHSPTAGGDASRTSTQWDKLRSVTHLIGAVGGSISRERQQSTASNTKGQSRDDTASVSPSPQRQSSVVTVPKANPKVAAQQAAAALLLDGGEDSDDDADNNNEEDDSIFSEKEYNALFALSMWFLDNSHHMVASSARRASQLLAQRRRQGSVSGPQPPQQDPLAGGGYARIQQLARAATPTFAAALARFEYARKIRLRAARQVDAVALKRRSSANLPLPQVSIVAEPSVDGNPPSNRVMRGSVTSAITLSINPDFGGLFTPGAPVLNPTATPQAMNTLVPPSPLQSELSQANSDFKAQQTTERQRVDKEMPAAANRLATPIIFLSSYMKIHGTSWCQNLFKELLALLADPSFVLYVTDEDTKISPPPIPRPETQQATSPTPRLQAVGKVVLATIAIPHSAHQTVSQVSSPLFPAVGNRRSSNNYSGIRSENSLFGGSFTDGSHHSGAVRRGSGMNSFVSNGTDDSMLLTSAKLQRTATNVFADTSGSGHDPLAVSSDDASQFASDGFAASDTFHSDDASPSEEFFRMMLHKESVVAANIQKATEMFFTALANSHTSQRIPSGISFLITSFCASVHCHLLSGVVMSSQVNAEGIEADSLDMVDYYVKTLIGDGSGTTKSGTFPAFGSNQSTPAVPSLSAKVPSPFSDVASPLSALSSSPPKQRMATFVEIEPPQKSATFDAVPPPTPSASSSAAPAPPKSISIVTDVKTFRLAKFLLFDTWLLPLLSNAQRYGFIPPAATTHQLRNINAFVRYVKVIVNAPYLQRDKELANNPSVNRMMSSSEVSGNDRVVEAALQNVTIPPFISGIFNASTGQLVQLYRDPVDLIEEADSKLSPRSGGGKGGPGIDRRNSGRKKSLSGASLQVGRKSSRTMSPGLAGGGGFSSAEDTLPTARRQSTVKISSPSAASAAASVPSKAPFPQLNVQGKASLQISALEYYQSQDNVWPQYGKLSAALRKLNSAIGIAPGEAPTLVQDVESTSRLPTRTSGKASRSCAVLLDAFCWNVASDNDRHRVVAEFQVTPEVAVRSCETLFGIVSGQHPAVAFLSTGTGSVVRTVSPDPSGGGSRPSSVQSGQPGRVASVNTSEVSKATANGLSEDVVSMYLRCLHSVLMHSTTAATVLDNVSINHRKLFQQLLKNQHPQDDASALACALFPFLIVGVKDQPLVDVNAISLLTASDHRIGAAAEVPLPSAFVQAKRRLLARQLFLSTGGKLPDETERPSTAFSVAAAAAAGNQNRRKPSVVALNSALENGVPALNYFAPWWHYMSTALCSKALGVLQESSEAQTLQWDRRCKHHMKRYSHRESMDFTAQSTGRGPKRTVTMLEEKPKKQSTKGGGKKQSAVDSKKRKSAVKVPSPPPPKPSVASNPTPLGGGLMINNTGGGNRSNNSTPRLQPFSPPVAGFQGGSNGSRRGSNQSSGNVDVVAPRCSNPLMQRWREAVTNLLSHDEIHSREYFGNRSTSIGADETSGSSGRGSSSSWA